MDKDIELRNGVILDDGDWKTPMSNTNYLANASEDILSDGYNSAYGTPEYNYLGDGMFCVSVYCNVLGITTDREFLFIVFR